MESGSEGQPKWLLLLAVVVLFSTPSCQLTGVKASPSDPSTAGDAYTGVLMWKGDPSHSGAYDAETSLTLAKINASQFGMVGTFAADGLIIGQPLYVANVDMGASGTHNLILLVTEHDSVYALDADNLGSAPLWERHYLDPSNGIVPLPDNFGGRTTLGGEVGITGTPVIDPSTGAMYFVTACLNNGVAEQWLRAIDIKTGKDFGPGGVQIKASVPGDGVASVNGTISFDPSLENQRAGLAEVNGSVLVAWASFSDYGAYHGWLMAFDAASLQLQAVFNPTPQTDPTDPADGPADHGGGAGIWQGSAAPAIDSDGYIYLDAADGSFTADQGGNDYGDSVLKLQLNNGKFQVADWFTPSNQACIDIADLELGSGGVALLPGGAASVSKAAITIDKEGRLYLLNANTLGHYNAGGPDQIPQEFMVGEKSCTSGLSGVAEGAGWNRLYGDPAYWNGNVYAQASSLQLKQYQFQNGQLNPTPVAESPTASGLRGGNIVVSANGNQDGVVWAYEKSAAGEAILHAYDATNVSHELWNSNQNAGRDQLGTGIAFSTPVIAGGRVIVTSDVTASIYGVLQ